MALFGNITVSFWVLVGIGFGWVWSVMLLIGLILVLKMTPATTFLKAIMMKLPVAFIKYRDGNCEFKTGKQDVPGCMEIKKMGPVQMIEGSAVREIVTGRPIFSVFAEHGTSHPYEYPVIVQTLREWGFEITDADDYTRVVKALADDKNVDAYIAQLPDDKKDAMRALIKDIKVNKRNIDIKPYKTILAHELATMFPFNMHPTFIEQYATAAVMARMKKQKMQRELLLYSAIAVLIIVIAAVIAYRYIGGTGGGQTVIQVTPELLKNAASAANGTVVI